MMHLTKVSHKHHTFICVKKLSEFLLITRVVTQHGSFNPVTGRLCFNLRKCSSSVGVPIVLYFYPNWSVLYEKLPYSDCNQSGHNTAGRSAFVLHTSWRGSLKDWRKQMQWPYETLRVLKWLAYSRYLKWKYSPMTANSNADCSNFISLFIEL